MGDGEWLAERFGEHRATRVNRPAGLASGAARG